MITIHIMYQGEKDQALQFAKEMTESGVVERIRQEEGNLRYEYYIHFEDPSTILLIDSWENQEALDKHHASSMMNEIARLREKYDIHMTVERYTSDDSYGSQDEKYIRK